MKNLFKLSLFLIMALGISMNTFAQQTSSATANTTATIVTPLSISKATDLAFGNVAVSASVAGTVVMPAKVDGERTVTGGCTLPATQGTVSAASFDVTGEGDYTYSITLPTSVTITDDASNNMTVDAFTSDPTPTGTLDADGNQTLYVGATLNVAAAQVPGNYSNTADLTVTVCYN